MNKKKTKKRPKVYIPPYKIIILCGSIIAVCMLLLLVTNLVSIKKTDKEEKVTLAQRYTDENKENKQSPSIDEIKGSNAKGNSTKQLEEPKKQADSKKQSEPKKQIEQKNQTETAKTTTPSSAQNVTTASNATPTPATVSATTTTVPAATTVPTAKTTVPSTVQKPQTENFNFPAAVNHAQLVFVFDDGGQNLAHLEKFMDLPFPITVAVLPQIAHSKEAADRIRKSRNEVMLHQPMQALNKNVNPGPGAITPNMDENQIISTLFQNINELGPIAGMNNHEGSAITADAEKMSTILKFASESGLFFLDSRTNVDTKVPYVASELGYSYYERNIFLDNEKDPSKKRSDILNEINKGLALANKNGVVIMIGHIWSADVLPGILKEIYPELVQKGYTFSTVSKSKAKK